MKNKITKQEKSWILYDWANSVYATNILAVIFPIYFNSVCQASGADNLVLWSYGTSAATFLVAVLAPVGSDPVLYLQTQGRGFSGAGEEAGLAALAQSYGLTDVVII